MLTQQIPAYPFLEYADDDDIRSFFDMFNAAAQQYLDFFVQNPLAYYPGLFGPLLQWVALGLYGQPYYSALGSQGAAAVGPLNTADLNAIPLNAYTGPTETYYQVTDDVFKRILTWNFFKGDGTRFCPRWLKRRIMRFLIGVDGIDPEPWNSEFVVGCENTTPISVQFSGQTCTVSINQIAASQLTQLTPNILEVFSAAFLAPGLLEKPIEWNYVVDIVTTIQAVVSPLSLSMIGASGTEGTGNATVSVLGGTGAYTYAWTWLSGGSGITIAAPSSHITDFTATGLTSGQTLNGIAQCLVTDTGSSETTTCAVNVTIARVSAPTATATPASIDTAGATDNVTSPMVVANPVGGGAPYTYLWTWQSGGAGIGIDSPNTQATTFTAVGLFPGNTDSGVALCTITDAYNQTTTLTVSVEITRATALLASITPNTLTVIGGAPDVTTGATAVTASAGDPPYGYSWAWQSGGSGISIDSPTSASTAFTSSGIPEDTTVSGVAVCTVTDSSGQKAQVTCSVSITRESTITLSVSPSAQNSSGPALSQTTGVSTVTAANGASPYTYSWIWLSGGAGIAINNPTSAATSFTAADMTFGNSYSGLAQCTVTDIYDQTAQITVSVQITCAAGSVNPTITAGLNEAESGGNGAVQIGYVTGPGSPNIGAISSGAVPPGMTLTEMMDIYALVEGEQHYASSSLSVSGFSSDPTQAWLIQAIANGVSYSGSSATYSYANGISSWFWTSGPFGFAPGTQLAVTITYE